MRVSCQQLNFVPWAGYWHKIKEADSHIVQIGWNYSNADFTNKVRFHQSSLTIPIERPGLGTPIKDLKIASPRGVYKVGKTLQQAVSKDHPLKGLYDKLAELCFEKAEKKFLVDVTLPLFTFMALMLAPGCSIRISEDPTMDGCKTTNLFELLTTYEPSMTEYLSGRGGVDYMDLSKVPEGVKVYLQSIASHAPPHSVLQTLRDPSVTFDDLWEPFGMDLWK